MKHIKNFESKKEDTVLSHYKKINGEWVDIIEKEPVDREDLDMATRLRISRENIRIANEERRKEEQRLIDIENKRINDRKLELKTEFDLVFIDFIDRGISTYINYNMERYTYNLELRYTMNSNIDISAKTFKKISEDILDAESYIKYLKTKYDMNGYTEFSAVNGVYKLFIYMKIKDVK